MYSSAHCTASISSNVDMVNRETAMLSTPTILSHRKPSLMTIQQQIDCGAFMENTNIIIIVTPSSYLLSLSLHDMMMMMSRLSLNKCGIARPLQRCWLHTYLNQRVFLWVLHADDDDNNDADNDDDDCNGCDICDGWLPSYPSQMVFMWVVHYDNDNVDDDGEWMTMLTNAKKMSNDEYNQSDAV